MIRRRRPGVFGWSATALALLIAVGCGETSRELTAAAAPARPPFAATDFTYHGELTQGGWARGTVPEGTVALTLDGAPVRFPPDGGFLVGFDRDAGSVAILSARLADGRQIVRTIALAPRAWRIEWLNIARSPGGPTEAFLALRPPELARIEAARASESGAQGWRQNFVWPVIGRISGLFGAQRVYRGEPGAYHSGIDISTGTVGTLFVAPADGVVTLAARTPFTLEGNLLMIDHGQGLNSAFLHCSEILVKEGQAVRQGQPIGRIGMTGRATGPHLHWSLRWRDARLDPILFTGPMR